MNLSIEKRNYIDSVLDDKTLGWLFPALETGQATCRAFMDLNDEFFNCSDFLNTVPGHLLSYSINKQLFNQCLLPSSPFELNKEQINNRNKYCIPVLKRNNITVSIMRSSNRKTIENNDIVYLKKKCTRNNELDGQISMFESDICDAANYHGVLLYGTNKYWEGIGFADIVFFDSKLKHMHHSLDLIDKLHIYESSMSSEDKKKSILNAQNIIKDLKTQMGG